MGNIPVHPNEKNRRPATMAELTNYLDDRRDWNAGSVANEGMLGIEDSSPNTTYGRQKLSRVRQVDKLWINEAQPDDLDYDLIEEEEG